ncbi:MAG TPA: integrin alpha [Caldilineaceae bacterium]|nr:integrin alpha [Caldilineaceae bacterium]
MQRNPRLRTLCRVTLLSIFLAVLLVGLPVAGQAPFVEENVTILYEMQGENIGDGFGWVGANLGDLNGDGVNDFGTTAPFYGGDQALGKIYIYSGADGTLLNEATGVEGNRFGYSLSSAGDVNGDGTPDYIVGGAGPANRIVVYAGADHTVIHDLTTPSEVPENFGASVAGAGDVNGDGYAGLLVGANRADVSETVTDTGRIYVLSGVDGAVIWQQDGNGPQALLGSGVGLVGDVNGDGVPDQVAAAPGAGANGLGEAYVYSGVDGTILLTLTPTEEANSGGTYGVFFASGAGDTNNDGTPDIFVGDYAAYRGEASGTGRAYIYSGVDGSVLHVFEAEADGDGLGPGRGIPDVDGDGFDDVTVAAWQSSAAVPTGGKVYVHSGQNGTLLHTVTGAIEADALGVDALAVGDLNGDGNMAYMLTSVGRDFNGTDVGRIDIVTFAPAEQATMPAVTVQPLLGGCQPIRPQ